MATGLATAVTHQGRCGPIENVDAPGPSAPPAAAVPVPYARNTCQAARPSLPHRPPAGAARLVLTGMPRHLAVAAMHTCMIFMFKSWLGYVCKAELLICHCVLVQHLGAGRFGGHGCLYCRGFPVARQAPPRAMASLSFGMLRDCQCVRGWDWDSKSSPAHGEGWCRQRRTGPPHDVVKPDQRNVRLNWPDACQYPSSRNVMMMCGAWLRSFAGSLAPPTRTMGTLL